MKYLDSNKKLLETVFSISVTLPPQKAGKVRALYETKVSFKNAAWKKAQNNALDHRRTTIIFPSPAKSYLNDPIGAVVPADMLYAFRFKLPHLSDNIRHITKEDFERDFTFLIDGLEKYRESFIILDNGKPTMGLISSHTMPDYMLLPDGKVTFIRSYEDMIYRNKIDPDKEPDLHNFLKTPKKVFVDEPIRTQRNLWDIHVLDKVRAAVGSALSENKKAFRNAVLNLDLIPPKPQNLEATDQATHEIGHTLRTASL